MKTEDVPQVKVGDFLAFSYGYGKGNYRLEKITAITPTGIIRCGGYQLDPNLRIKGKRNGWHGGPYHAEIVTKEIRESIERDRILSRLNSVKWEKFDIESLRRIAKEVDSAKWEGIKDD